jgi:hypothetical protein
MPGVKPPRPWRMVGTGLEPVTSSAPSAPRGPSGPSCLDPPGSLRPSPDSLPRKPLDAVRERVGADRLERNIRLELPHPRMTASERLGAERARTLSSFSGHEVAYRVAPGDRRYRQTHRCPRNLGHVARPARLFAALLATVRTAHRASRRFPARTTDWRRQRRSAVKFVAAMVG